MYRYCNEQSISTKEPPSDALLEVYKYLTHFTLYFMCELEYITVLYTLNDVLYSLCRLTSAYVHVFMRIRVLPHVVVWHDVYDVIA